MKKATEIVPQTTGVPTQQLIIESYLHRSEEKDLEIPLEVYSRSKQLAPETPYFLVTAKEE